MAQTGQDDAFSNLPGVQATASGESPATFEPETWAVLNPLPTEANGAWEFSGPSGTWTGHGFDTIRVNPGTYTVQWLPTPGYTVPTPSTQSFYVSYGDTRSFSGLFNLYSGPVGTLVLDPNPLDLDAGWVLVGPDDSTYFGSGPQTYDNMPVGAYTLIWQQVESYSRPDPSTVYFSIEENLATTVVGEYVPAPLGDIVIDPLPSPLVAPWVLHGPDSYQIAGEGYTYLSGVIAEAEYIIEWGAVSGFFTPEPDTAYLDPLLAINFSTEYLPLPTVYGTITLESEPDYYPDRLWTLYMPDSSPPTGRGDSNFITGRGDTTLTYLPVGDYSLVWSAGDHTWLTPDPEQYDFTLYDQNHATLSGTYSPVTFGSIHIHGFWDSELLATHWTLEGPNNVFIDGVGEWHDAMMPVGHYTLKWQEEPGYIFVEPDSVAFLLEPGVFGQRHHHPYGKLARLYVDPSPHALKPTWMISTSDTNFVPIIGDGPTIITDLEPGEYRVEWLHLEGWSLPSPAVVDVNLASGDDETVRGEYWGNDVVVIDVSPPDLDAAWSLVNSDTLIWTGTGDAVLPEMDSSLYFLTWSPHAGYATPDPATTHRTLYSGGSIVFHGEYELDFPDLVAGSDPHGIFAACPDDTSTIRFDFFNSGRAPAVGPVTTEVWLSRSSSPFGIDDVMLASQTRNMIWNPGVTRRDTFQFTTPDDIVPGYYYLYYVVDTLGNVEETDENNNLSWGSLEPGDYEYFLNYPVADPPRGVVNPAPGEPFNVRWDMPSYALGVEVFEDNSMVYSGVSRDIDLTRAAGTFTYRIRGRNRCGCGELSDPLTVTVGASNAIMIDCYPNHIDIPWTITGPDNFSESGVRDASWIEMDPGEYIVTFGEATSWDIIGDATRTLTLVEGESLTFSGRYGHSPFYYEEYYGLTPMYHPSSISVSEIVYATDGGSTFIAYDVSDPKHPQQVGSYPFGATIHDFHIVNNIAYVVAGNQLVALNIASPQAITLSNTYALPGSNGTRGDIAGSAGKLFVADNAGIHWFDANYAGSLTYSNYFQLPIPLPVNLEVYGNTLLLSWEVSFGIMGLDTSYGGFEELNLAYSAIPDVTQMQTVGPNYVYMINGSGQFHIASGSMMPYNLSPVSTFSAPGMQFQEFHVVGNRVYIATSAGMLVLDVSDPTNPVQVGLFGTNSPAIGINFLGNYSYIGVADGGTWVVEVAGANSIVIDPSPDELDIGWSLERPDGAQVTLSGDLMLNNQTPGVYTINWGQVEGMASPPPMTQELPPGGHIYFFSEFSVVSAAEDSDLPTRFELFRAYPNPFNPVTNIKFALPKASHVSLKVYDLSGRLVKTILDNEVRATGRYIETWYGRDNSDHQVASGVYFYKLSAGSFNAVNKMTLLK